MSTIVKTDAVVLRGMKYRETSKIITFYTRQFGKVSGIVKGARQAKNKYGSALEPMSYVSVVFYRREGREIHIISQCDLMKPFRRLSDDLAKMAVGMAIVELVNIVAHEEEENVPLFTLMVDCLDAVNDATKNPSHVLYYFELHLVKILGFQPRFNRCISCEGTLRQERGEENIYIYHIGKGGPLCPKCSEVSGQKLKMRKHVLEFLRNILSVESVEDVLNLEMDKPSHEEIEQFLWGFLRFHVSGIRALKSNKVFSQILVPA
ncbi:MAG: DNA repair protein RecO [Ignavibacteria bacterium]|nr:DNA repair protein RecO [Ignavibacteria bacterium]